MTTIYGISNCDTIKKARKWLEQQGVEYQFHDVRKDGLDEALLDSWLAAVGWEVLLNKRGTTWRALDDATKNSIDAASARALLLAQPAMIKRPVLVTDQRVEVGFKADHYQTIFS